jgi:hypothetical protein
MKKSNYQTDSPCVACGTTSFQRTFHHLKSRGSGGSDEAWNLLPVCSQHHNEVHKIGLVLMANNYLGVKNWLIKSGWEFCEFRNKWVNVEAGR